MGIPGELSGMQLAEYLAMNNDRDKSPTKRGSDIGSWDDPRREIIEYLLKHPSAADTVEGILDWWIPMQRYDNAKEEITQALNDLVRQGLIEVVVLSNGSRLYRLHKQQLSPNRMPKG
jgi:hypothetical protein